MKRFSIEYLWPVLIVLSIFFASGQSELASPDFKFNVDKLAHFTVFGALATSLIRLKIFYRKGWRGTLQVWVLIALYGALDEWRQSYTPGRSVEFGDWIADVLGSAVAVVLYQGWPTYRRLLETKVKPSLIFTFKLL